MSPMISKGVERRERIDKMSESSVKKSVMSEFGDDRSLGLCKKDCLLIQISVQRKDNWELLV